MEEKKRKTQQIANNKIEIKGYREEQERIICEKSELRKKVTEQEIELERIKNVNKELEKELHQADKDEQTDHNKRTKTGSERTTGRQENRRESNDEQGRRKICISFQNKNCRYGNTCKFDHNQICNSILKRERCKDGSSCKFSHDESVMCKWQKEGKCKNEHRCRFLHSKGGNFRNERTRSREENDERAWEKRMCRWQDTCKYGEKCKFLHLKVKTTSDDKGMNWEKNERLVHEDENKMSKKNNEDNKTDDNKKTSQKENTQVKEELAYMLNEIKQMKKDMHAEMEVIKNDIMDQNEHWRRQNFWGQAQWHPSIQTPQNWQQTPQNWQQTPQWMSIQA